MPTKPSSVAYGDLVSNDNISSSSNVSLTFPNDDEDHVLTILHSESLQYRDMETLVAGLNPQRAQDILMSYRILSTLTQYLEETNSWTFCLLNNYDFQSNVRQFDLDVAIVVGKRAEHLLAEIHAWNIPRLKRMVTSLTAYYSDEATILTVMVLRIVSKSSDLEFTLQLALSRATLIKIHYEMAGLFSKLPGGSETGHTDSISGSRNDDLVESYRRFVTQLLEEIENAPFESVQQELFQVVRDLRSMFSKFSDSQMLKSLEDSPQENTFFDINSSNAAHTKLPPLAEEWHDDDFTETPGPLPKLSQTSKNNFNTHKRTVSSSTVFSSGTTASARSTISEDLPHMMHAFEIARKREEYNKHHQHASFSSSHTTPPDTPVRSTTADTKSPTASSISSPSILSSPTSSTSTHTRQQMWASTSQSKKSGSPSSNGALGSALVVKNEPEAMQVKMVSNRMMIYVDGKYHDMQEWAAKANSNSAAMASGHPHNGVPGVMTIPSSASSVTASPAAPAAYGLGSLFQPWLRPVVKPIAAAPTEDAASLDKQLVRKDKAKRIPKSQSIDNILSKPLQPGTSTLDMLRSSSMPMKSAGTGGFSAANGTTAGAGTFPSVSAFANGPVGSGFPHATSSLTAMQNSSWIKGVIGKAEDKFGKNYNSAMNFTS